MDRLPPFRRIAETLRQRIAAGELKPGDQLPPISDSMKDWEVTRITLLKAYQLLAAEGLLVVKGGKGTHVATDQDRQLDPARIVRLLAADAPTFDALCVYCSADVGAAETDPLAHGQHCLYRQLLECAAGLR